MGLDVSQEWVSLGPEAGHGSRPCQGLYHRPVGSRAPSVAFIASHYEVDFAEHYMAPLLAERGFGFLGWNTRYRGNDAYFLLEPALTDIGVGVQWLRDVQGVDTVVLLGNSGGGSLMAAYQAEATEATEGDLPPGDLYISLNAHAGRPEVLTAWLDPAVVDETDPLSVDPSLDMFDPANGPPYAPPFVTRYRAAQEARNDRITAWVHEELARLAAGKAWDRLFTVPRAWADLRFLDLTLDPSDRTPGCYAGDARRANYGPFGLARATTLRSWLSMWSLAESPCRGHLHLPSVHVPALVVQSLADRGVFPADAHAIHDALGSADKTLTFLPGAHYFEDGTRPAAADLVEAWTTEHL
jgi:pimeloyl-ACP methyl ester carboxylesterase